MKKLLIAFLSLSAFMADAQITIIDSDMPNVNDTFRISTTTDQWNIDPTTPSGASASWDYSYLSPNSQRLDTFYAVGDTPTGYQLSFNNSFQYPDYVANYATKGEDIALLSAGALSNVFNYYKYNLYSYRHVGFGATFNGLPLSIRHDTIREVYQFPLNYGDQDTTQQFYKIALPNFGYYEQYSTYDSEVIGWGNLTLPMGSYDALLVEIKVNAIDSLYIDNFGFGQSITRPEVTEYHWLADGEGVPLLKIETGLTGGISSIEYRDDFVNFASLDAHQQNDLHIYPVPAQNSLKVENLNTSTSYRILNIQGQEVLKGKVSGTTVIALESLPAGMYVLEVEDYPQRLKFMKQ